MKNEKLNESKNDDHNIPSCPIANDHLAQHIWDDPALLAAMASVDENEINMTTDNVTLLSDVQPSIEITANKKRKLFSAWPLSLAASILVTVFIAFFVQEPTSELLVNHAKKVSSHTTSIGKLSNITLVDGSALNLNADTHIRVIMLAEKRRVLLEKGEVFFNVTADKNRPFFVETPIGQVEVVGTSFNVDKTLQGVEIKVYEGKVRVHSQNGEEFVLLPGDLLTLNKEGSTQQAYFSTEIQPTWQQGSLDFKDKPMSYVIEKLNRYLEHKVYLEPSLKQKRITGRFVLNDIEQTLLLLSELYHLELLDEGKNRYLVPQS